MFFLRPLFLVNLVLLLIGGKAWSVEPYSGEFHDRSNRPYLVVQSKSYPIDTDDSDIMSSFIKLKSGDIISGLGEIQSNGRIRIHSIDYIGLKQLIGSWKTANSVFAVVPNFTELSLVAGPLRKKGSALQSVGHFIYSVRPSSQQGFNLFLTDSQQTLVAEISIVGRVMVMKIYDPRSGQLNSNFRFTKL